MTKHTINIQDGFLFQKLKEASAVQIDLMTGRSLTGILKRFVRFAVVVVVAGVTRIIPYTFASFGLYEIVSIVMFWVLGEGFLAGTTVTFLDSILFNTMTLLFFVVSMRVAACPSVLETWNRFYELSTRRSSG